MDRSGISGLLGAGARSASRPVVVATAGLAVLALLPFGAARNSYALALVALQALLLAYVSFQPWAASALTRGLARNLPAVILFSLAVGLAVRADLCPPAPVDPHQHRIEVLKLGGVACAILTGLAVGGSVRRRRIFDHAFSRLLLVYLAISLALFFLKPAGLWTALSAVPGRWTATFLSPNTAGLIATGALLAGLIEPLRLYGQARTLGNRPMPILAAFRAPLSLLLVVVAVAALLLSASRAGIFLTIFALFAAPIWLLTRSKYKSPNIILGCAVTITVSLLFLTDLPINIPLFFQRVGNLPEDFAERAQTWRDHAAIAWGDPIRGWGLGSFTTLNDGITTPARFERLGSLRAAHNMPLQLIEEGGALFSACIALATAWMLAVGWYFGLKRSADRPAGGIFYAAIASVWLIQSVFDFGLSIPAIAHLWGLLLGISAAPLGGRVYRRANKTVSEVLLQSMRKPAWPFGRVLRPSRPRDGADSSGSATSV